MSVLDVDETISVEKPRAEFDAFQERRPVDRWEERARMVEQQRPKFSLYFVPMELDVVVAVNDGQGVPIRNEHRELVEDIVVAITNAPQLPASVVRCVAEPVLLFLF